MLAQTIDSLNQLIDAQQHEAVASGLHEQAWHPIKTLELTLTLGRPTFKEELEKLRMCGFL